MDESQERTTDRAPDPTPDPTPDRPPVRTEDELQPLAVSTARVVLWGELAWVVALAVILAVPSLHEGDRHWWPWVPVAGIALGLLGFSYVRRGRGNAAGAK